MSLDYLRLQARNNAWSNETLSAAVQTLPEEKLRAPYPSFFGSIPRTLNHILDVDLYYIDGFLGEGGGRSVFLTRADVDDMAELAAAQAISDQRLIDLCDGLTDDTAKKTVALERPDGMSHEQLDHALIHLFLHQVHHRGQVHGMLSQAGVDPPQLDDFFLQYGRVDSAKRYWEDL